MSELDRAVDRFLAKVPVLNRQVAEERRTSAALLRRIDRLSSSQRVLLLSNCRAGRSLIDALLSRARLVVRDDAHRAIELCRLAAVAVTRLEASAQIELGIVCAAELANARRAAGDLRGAAAVWRRIDALRVRPTDPLDLARHYSLRASFEDWARHPKQAVALLRRSAAIYRRMQDHRELARVLSKLSVIHLHGGDEVRALDSAVDAAAILSAEDELPLRLVALHNLAAAAAAVEDAPLLEYVLRKSAPLYRRAGSEMWTLRRDWLYARLSILRGELPLAAGRLERVAGAFRARSMPYDVALVGLDQLHVDALRGAWVQVANRAEALTRAFNALGVEREALASLLALKQVEGAQALEVVARCVRHLRSVVRSSAAAS